MIKEGRDDGGGGGVISFMRNQAPVYFHFQLLRSLYWKIVLFLCGPRRAANSARRRGAVRSTRVVGVVVLLLVLEWWAAQV
jgi:hypothetical protein